MYPDHPGPGWTTPRSFIWAGWVSPGPGIPACHSLRWLAFQVSPSVQRNANAVPSPKHRGELLDDPGEVVEGVSELVPRRHRVVTEAGVVGSEHAVAVGQGRDQVAEHLRAGREAVQQQYRRRVFRPGLAVEDVQVAGL